MEFDSRWTEAVSTSSCQGENPQEDHAFGHDEQIRRALEVLLRAHGFARELQRDVWDFAVEASCLKRLGLTTCDFRWLTCKGVVEHAREVCPLEGDERSFRPTGRLSFPKRTCLVLTEKGVEFAHSVLRPKFQWGAEVRRPASVSTQGEGNSGENVTPLRLVPQWDADYRELRFQGLVVKQFKLPSQNQELVLMAFEEESWPPRIDDPLPQSPHFDPKQRLRETIRSLNRNQKNSLLSFKGDGTGQGILWQPANDGAIP